MAGSAVEDGALSRLAGGGSITLRRSRPERAALTRIVTVTPNAALDWTCFVARLRPGERHTVRASHRQAGGKGVNVARVLAELGHSARSVVVVGGETGEEVLRDLERSGLAAVPVLARGESRTCLEVIDAASGMTTQLHGVGVAADADTAEALVAAVEQEIDGADWLALCGSLPIGLPLDCYATLIRAARARGVAVALDTSGEALRLGFAAGPDLLRINREEAEALGTIETDGVRFGLVSDGAREIEAWSPSGRMEITPPTVRVRNAIGCGDAMLAGLLARIESEPFERCVRFAVALASAAAETDFVGGGIVARGNALLGEVAVSRKP